MTTENTMPVEQDGLVINGRKEDFNQFFPDVSAKIDVLGKAMPSKGMVQKGYDYILFNMALSTVDWGNVVARTDRWFSLLRSGGKFVIAEPSFDWLFTKSGDAWEWADFNAHLYNRDNRSAWRMDDIRALLSMGGFQILSANIAKYQFTFESGRKIEPWVSVVYGVKP